MKKNFLHGLITIFFFIGILLPLAYSQSDTSQYYQGNPDDIPRMTKEELKEKLGNPDYAILDCRRSSDFFASDFKIPGADRPTYGYANITKSQYPNKTLILYCATPKEETSARIGQTLIEQRDFKKIYILKGGWEEWLKAKYPVEKK